MARWLTLAILIAVLAAILAYLRPASDSDDSLPVREHPDVAPTTSAAGSEVRSNANGTEATGLAAAGGAGTAEHEAILRMGGESASPGLVGGPSWEDPGMASGSVAGDTGADTMPGLVILPAGSDFGTSGPSQVDLGLPGPEAGGGEIAGASRQGQGPESAPETAGPQQDNDPTSLGPSQIDLGLPGPGESRSEMTESAESATEIVVE